MRPPYCSPWGPFLFLQPVFCWSSSFSYLSKPRCSAKPILQRKAAAPEALAMQRLPGFDIFALFSEYRSHDTTDCYQMVITTDNKLLSVVIAGVKGLLFVLLVCGCNYITKSGGMQPYSPPFLRYSLVENTSINWNLLF